jgi:hypothetical protein
LIFSDDCKKFNNDLYGLVNVDYHELVSKMLNSIDDYFYILYKVSFTRSINTFNLNFGITILNKIKENLFEKLREFIDLKFSSILIKSDIKQYKQEIKSAFKFISKEEPYLHYNNHVQNLALICCLNDIDQIISNIKFLYEDGHKTIINNFGLNDKDADNRDVILINTSFDEFPELIKEFEKMLFRKIKLSFEFLFPNLKASTDLMNSTNYIIEDSQITSLEYSSLFSEKFIEETRKLTNQFKMQSSENVFNSFIKVYCEFVCSYIENHLNFKKFTSYGVLILDKDLNKIINFFQTIVTISIRDRFNKLLTISQILNFESNEDLINYLTDNPNEFAIGKTEILKIFKQKIN